MLHFACLVMLVAAVTPDWDMSGSASAQVDWFMLPAATTPQLIPGATPEERASAPVLTPLPEKKSVYAQPQQVPPVKPTAEKPRLLHLPSALLTEYRRAYETHRQQGVPMLILLGNSKTCPSGKLTLPLVPQLQQMGAFVYVDVADSPEDGPVQLLQQRLIPQLQVYTRKDGKDFRRTYYGFDAIKQYVARGGDAE